MRTTVKTETVNPAALAAFIEQAQRNHQREYERVRNYAQLQARHARADRIEQLADDAQRAYEGDR